MCSRWMLTLVVFSLLWWSWRTFRAAWRFACGSHNSILMGPRKCTSGGDRYMRSRDRYTYRQDTDTAPLLTLNKEFHHKRDGFSFAVDHIYTNTSVFTNPQTSSLTYCICVIVTTVKSHHNWHYTIWKVNTSWKHLDWTYCVSWPIRAHCSLRTRGFVEINVFAINNINNSLSNNIFYYTQYTNDLWK